MKRDSEIRYLFPILLIISTGFTLVYSSFIDRDIPSVLATAKGLLDISNLFLTPFPNALYGLFFVAAFLLIHLYLRLKLPDADPFILPVIALLSGIGALMIFRLAPDLASWRNDAIRSILSHNPAAGVTDNVFTLAQLGLKHMLVVVAGVLSMVAVIYLFNSRTFAWLSSKKYLWVLASAILITATMLFGREINGRRLWLFGFQTVELVKFFMLLFIAGYVYEQGRGIDTYRQTQFRSWCRYAGPFVVMWFFAVFPIFIQKDLGPTFLIFVLFLLMFYCAGSRSVIIVLFIIFIIGAGYISYEIGFPSVVRERLDMMLDPFGRSESMSRALWSLSSGGIFGLGIGYGQPYRIPVVQSDYTFSAICEEMGFIVGIAVILAYGIFLYRCYRISLRTANFYKKILVMSIGTLICLQAFIIICGNIGMIPMTGITLPFVSYGGSSMMISFIMAGIVLKISGEG